MKVPKSFPVQPLKRGQVAKDKATCGTCGRSWDDAIPTTWTPAPSARCPFEYFHDEPATVDASSRTPAPWSVQDSSTGDGTLCVESYEPHFKVVAYVDAGNNADARLISAAPDLLKSLKELQTMLAQNHAAFKNFPGFAYRMYRAEHAIDKAEGRNQ